MSAAVRTLQRWARPLRRRLRPTELERRIAALDLRAGDLTIDCGANVGDVTALLVRRGATVHAFEPNPHAFGALEERFAGVSKVVLHQQAVLDENGTARLFLHVDAADDPVGASIGSSLLEFKGNVDAESFVDVETVDLAEFVLGLELDVALLKLDVEGVECRILDRLVDTGAIERVAQVAVEFHDRHIPALAADYDRMRARLVREGLTERVVTDWA